MIVGYRDKRTADFAAGNRVKAFSGIERPARLKLDRKGQYSIRVNDQWRLCFEWPDGSSGPTNVEIVDYH
jgi:proteic killer suppression protein